MIRYRNAQEIDLIRTACRIVADVLQRLRAMVLPGATTADLDRMAEEWTLKAGARPAFKGYRPAGGSVRYPATLCVSINEEIVHGIPSPKRVLHEGDIVGLDFGVVSEGYYGDAAITVPVGKVAPRAAELIEVTRTALEHGVAQARVGNRVRDVSASIQAHVEAHGFSVVRDFVGHGIGQQLHEEPQVPNYVAHGQNPRLRQGLVLAIEPMVCLGGYEVEVLEDGWTAVTQDRQKSAHFEHSVAILASGPEILTTV